MATMSESNGFAPQAIRTGTVVDSAQQGPVLTPGPVGAAKQATHPANSAAISARFEPKGGNRR